MPADKKTRERTKGAATAVQAMHGDSFSANRVEAGPSCSTSFGVKADSPTLVCRDDVLVECAAAAPNLCLLPLEMRKPTAAGGLLSTNITSTATGTTFHQLPFWFCLIEEIKSGISIIYASYYSSCFWWIINRQAPFWPGAIATKSRQHLVFDPGESTCRLRACPFLGTWRALLCGKVHC